MTKYKVTCFGAGFVGIPTSAVLALHNSEVQFVVYDINTQRINLCKQNKPHIYQHGLIQILEKTNGKNLNFTDNLNQALQNSSVIFLALPTPTKNFGKSKGKAYDLSYTEVAIRNIINYFNQKQMTQQIIIVQKSTVPIGTGQMIEKIIREMSIKQNIDKYIITSNPQFLAQGTAVRDLLKPDRVVIGSKQGHNIANLLNLYNYVNKQKIILTNQCSSQLSKLVANCFLAQRVSSINSIAILCEEYQSDVKQIKQCIATDSRIGNKFLNSSVGFGGSCFKKDILALAYLAESKGLTEVANYWQAVIDINQFRKKNFVDRIFQTLNSNIKNKKICVLGTAFKKDTNDPRESPAVQICHFLLEQGAQVQIYDPETSLENFIYEIKLHELWKQTHNQQLKQFEKVEDAVKQTHAIIILTQWDQFKKYDYSQFYKIMEKPAYIFDGRNLLQQKNLKQIGFIYNRIGKKFV